METSFVKFKGLTLPEMMIVLGLSETPEEYIKNNLDSLSLFENFQRAKGEKNIFSCSSTYTNFSLIILLCIKEHQSTVFIIIVSNNNKVVYFDKNFFQNSEKLLAFLEKDISKIMNIIDNLPKEAIKIYKDRKGNFNCKKKNQV